MNLLLANSFTTFFNNLFANWQLVLFIVLTIIILLAIFFKRFKILYIVLCAVAGGIGLVLLIFLIISAIRWDLFAFIDFLIAWGPTVLFSVIVVLSTLINAKRGRRKSLILMIHAVSAAILWLVLYVVIVKTKLVDEGLVKLANLILGENGLQDALNVSAEATSVRNILALFVENLAGEGSLGILLQDTSAYIYTLADLAYHLAFAVLCYIFYLFTVVFLYLLYLCFYSEHKYKRKKNKALAENKTDSRYKKHRIGGGIIGLVRGVVIGLMCMSFLGAGFYVVAGGRGDGKLKDIEASGQYEAPLRIYRSIESYGMQGIFMILNAMSDPSDMPYYLFAADLVFSGTLNDDRSDVSDDIYFTKELGSLTGLARDTIALLLKYGSDELTGALDGSSEQGLMSNVLAVMKDEAFREEFDLLIAQFNTPTYIYNFGMSLVSSVLANIDSMSFGASMSEQNRELIKIMFKEGHLSSYIPEDRELHDLNVMLDAENPWVTSGRNVRPYLTLQQLVKKNDFRVFLNIFLTAIAESGEGTDTFGLIRTLMPKIKELSLFDSGNSTAVDPVFARMYCFVQNAYLKAEDADGYSYNALLQEDVKWTKEIVALLDVAEDCFTIYDDVRGGESAVFNQLLYIFHESNPNRERDTELFDAVEDRISSSRILGKTLATSFIHKLLVDGLSQLFEGTYVPDNIVYETTYTENGNVLRYGELHYFLKSLRHLGTMDNQDLFKLLFGDGEPEMSEMLSTIADAMKAKDDDGNNFAYYATRSSLLRSVLSGFLITGGAEVLYVPKTACETNEKGEPINVIQSDQLEGVLNSMSMFVDFFLDCVESGEGYFEHIDEYLDNDDFMNLIKNNRIFEGSLAKIVKENFAGGLDTKSIVIPKFLEDNLVAWCTGKSGIAGELRHFLDAYLLLRNQAKKDKEAESGEKVEGYPLNLQSIISGIQSDQEFFLAVAATLGEYSEDFLASNIIYYTISNYIFTLLSVNELTIVVPLSARTALYDDALDYLIDKDELVCVMSQIKALGVTDDDGEEDDTNGKDLLKKLIEGRELIQGDILSASVVATIVNNASFQSALSLFAIPVSEGSSATYGSVGQQEYLNNGYYYLNPWYDELPKLLDALAVLFGHQMEEDDFVLNADNLAAALLGAMNNQEIMDVCLQSKILATRLDQLTSSLPDIPED